MESFDFLGMFASLESNQPKQSKKDLVAFESVFTEFYQEKKSTDYFYETD